uniref:Putative DNA binding, helix-turn-helix domain containing protein n=1 Tax=viral metagenome TaxID=1070528 RepID=A0A6M3L7C2_9ZZZZ
MTKKTWIKLKRGILDVKHVKSVGPALWLFCLLVDEADWPTGKVFGWTDRQAAADLGIKLNTARDWRQRLEKYKYITCQHVGQSLEIQIHNWTNPREYGGDILSRQAIVPADVADAWGDAEGDVETEPLAGGGDVQSDVQSDVAPERRFIESTYHKSGDGKNRKPQPGQFLCPRCGSPILEEHRGTPMELDCRLHRGMPRQRK